MVIALGIIFFSTISLIRASPLLIHEATRWIGLFIVGIAGALFLIGVMMLYQMRSELILDQIFNTVNEIQKKMKKEL